MRSIKLTKEGRRFLLAVALVGLASLNTGNNLIYLIFSMMISISVISFVAAFTNMRMLTFGIDFNEPLHANTSFRMKVLVHNKKMFPSYSLSLEIPVDISGELYFPVAKQGQNIRSFDDIVIKKRGKHLLSGLKLRTGFPFIFMYAFRKMDYRKELIVYPELFDVKRLLANVESYLSEKEAMVKGREGDFFSVREYVYGEESRNIDWKASAKMWKTMVREHSKSDDRLATVILDNGAPGEEKDFERSVSIAASLCAELIERDFYVRLIICKKVVPFGNGRTHLFKMLDILSEVQRMDVAECPISESIEGLSMLIISSGISGFSRIAPLCSGVIDARDI